MIDMQSAIFAPLSSPQCRIEPETQHTFRHADCILYISSQQLQPLDALYATRFYPLAYEEFMHLPGCYSQWSFWPEQVSSSFAYPFPGG
jgi:hypothetical protein